MLKIHNVPEKEPKSLVYQVFVNDQAAPCFFSRVSKMPFNTPWPGHQRDLNQTEEAPFISFESDEKVKITVKTEKIIKKAVVRPI